MVNQQLTDYVKQQLQGGVSKDAVKKALLDAGWPENDVNDSMNAAGPQSAASQPATTAVRASSPTLNPMAAMGGGTGGATVKPEAKFFSEAAPKESGSHGGKIAMMVMGAVIVALLVALGYVYYSFSGRLSALSGAPAAPSGSGDAAQLQQQVQKLSDDKNTLSGQITSLTGDNQALVSEVGFFAQATGTSTDIQSTIKGTLGGATGAYYLTTAHNVKITVKNSKDSHVQAWLKTLVGQSVELGGTHKAATPELTVTTVNGNPVANPPTPPAATSTATSSAPAASPAPAPNPNPAPAPATTTPPAATLPPPAAGTTTTTTAPTP